MTYTTQQTVIELRTSQSQAQLIPQQQITCSSISYPSHVSITCSRHVVRDPLPLLVTWSSLPFLASSSSFIHKCLHLGNRYAAIFLNFILFIYFWPGHIFTFRKCMHSERIWLRDPKCTRNVSVPRPNRPAWPADHGVRSPHLAAMTPSGPESQHGFFNGQFKKKKPLGQKILILGHRLDIYQMGQFASFCNNTLLRWSVVCCP